MATGAADAWLTPILMKKGRPAHLVSVLADQALAGDLAALLRSSTGSFGVRGVTMARWPAQRSFDKVEVDGQAVGVKVSPGRVKAEFDDAETAAQLTGRPVAEVIARAEAAWRSRPPAAGAELTEEPPAEPVPHTR